MSFIVSGKSGGGDFAPHPAGVFAARCTRIIDLGTQKSSYKGKEKHTRKVIIGFETEALMPDGEKAGQPFLIQQRYTLSIGEKAMLRKDLESWRGRKFTPQEVEGFDLKNVLNKGCMLNIVHDDSGDRLYANIAGIMPLPPSMRAPQAQGEVILFSLNDFQQSEFDKLSEKVQDTVKASPEYQELMHPSGRNKGAPSAAEDSNGGGIDDDDIPF